MTRKRYKRRIAAIVLAATMTLPRVAASEPPKVVASIKPVHSLVSGVMAGIGAPEILATGGASPHAYSLRPSKARLLHRADVIFWIGEGLETFLRKPIASLGRKARIVTLGTAPGVHLLEARRGGTWEEHVHEGGEHREDHAHGHDQEAHEHDHDKHEHQEQTDHDRGHGTKDVHIWLGRDNAKAIVRAAVDALARADSANAARYRHNGENVIARIDTLYRELQRTLAPVKRVPYLVFHDAYRYFERDHGLRAVGSISTHEARKPSAKRLHEIRRKVVSLKVRCIFAEPQFEPALVKTIAQGTTAGIGVLDPLGAKIDAGPNAYFSLLKELAKNLEDCLANTP